MGLPIDINELFTGRTVEWERLDWKEGWNPEAVLPSLCAFANDLHDWGGGYIVIGVAEDQGRPVVPARGVAPESIDRIQKEVLNLGYKIVPPYHPVMAPTVLENGAHVLVLWAPAGEDPPYRAPVSLAKDEQKYAYYIRLGSASVQAKPSVVNDLMQQATKVPFDDRVNHQAAVQDLQLRLIQAHLQEVRSELFEASSSMEFAQLCAQMKIVGGPLEALRPRNIGLMFFNDRPDQFFPTAWIDVVHFPQGVGGGRHIEQRFTGPLDMQLRSVLRYIRDTFIHEVVVKHEDRAEADRFVTFPFEAVEEALANAVYHRGYDTREPIEVRVTTTSLTITSYPGPDASVRVEALGAGQTTNRRYRNRRIGEFLKELRLTEGRGTGIPSMINAMRSNGSPDPLFRTDDERTFFTTELLIHPGARQTTSAQSTISGPTVTPTTPGTARVVGGIPAHVGEIVRRPRVHALLTFCLEARTALEMMDHLQVRARRTFNRNYLEPLHKEGLLDYTLPDAIRSRQQRHRTSELGRRALDSLDEDGIPQ